MPTYLDLSLYRPRNPGETASDTALLPEGPPTLANMGPPLNDGLLTAEALGIDAAEARRNIDRVWGLFQVVASPCFTDDDLPILREWLAGVTAGLREGLDEKGRPHGGLGVRLSGSPHFEADADGRLMVRSSRRRLMDVRDELEALLRMVDFAAAHDLWVAMSER